MQTPRAPAQREGAAGAEGLCLALCGLWDNSLSVRSTGQVLFQHFLIVPHSSPLRCVYYCPRFPKQETETQ